MAQPRTQPQASDGEGSEAESHATAFDNSNSETEEDGRIPGGFITMPSKGASLEDYEKLLKSAQLAIMEMKIELKNAKKENVVLAENQPRRRLKGVPKEISQHDKVIKDLGRQYAIMICPWVDLSCFGHKSRPDVDPLHPNRYLTKLSQHEANIAELFDFVPEELHSLMEKHSYFGDLFRSHVNAMRSTAAHAIRGQGSVIFDIKGNLIASGADRSAVPELEELIKVDGEYKPLPRILYPNNAMRKQDVFRTDVLAKILRILFFGPSSLSPNNVPRPKTNAEIWKVSNITAGSIAFAGILARFILSPDVEFSPKGATTNIDYLGDFNLYKRMLLSDAPRIRALIEWYDQKIFSRNIRKPTVTTSGDNNGNEDFEEMMRAIVDASLSDEEGGPPRDMDIESPRPTPDPPTAPVVTPSTEEVDNEEDGLDVQDQNRRQAVKTRGARGRTRQASTRRGAAA